LSRNSQKHGPSLEQRARRVRKHSGVLPSPAKDLRPHSSIKIENLSLIGEHIVMRVDLSNQKVREMFTSVVGEEKHDDIRVFFKGGKRGFEVVNMGKDASKVSKGKRSFYYSSSYIPPSKRSSSPEGPKLTAFEVAMSKARMRGSLRVAEILSGDDMLTGEEFGACLDVSRQTVDNWRRNGDLIGLEGPSRGVRYPEWQIKRDGLLTPGIAKVLTLVDGDAWAAYRFLVEDFPDASGDRLIDKLQNDDLDLVLNHIDAVLQGGYT